jgi:hypothetical protein
MYLLGLTIFEFIYIYFFLKKSIDENQNTKFHIFFEKFINKLDIKLFDSMTK